MKAASITAIGAASALSAGPGVDGPERPEVDGTIARAIDDGDRGRALMLCARHYGPAIGRLCMAILGSQEDAEDVTQETLVDAHEALVTWRREGTLRAFLLTIARRKCARLIERRQSRRTKLTLVHDAERDPASASAERDVLRRERAERARAALDMLRPSEREALLLRYAAGLSFREVGEACGIDEVTARKRVSRAIIHLRHSLDEEPGES
jgi:RNA polymerase sigma-70 factor (ECF subfamily)